MFEVSRIPRSFYFFRDDVSYLASQGEQAASRPMLRKVERPRLGITSTLSLYTCKEPIQPCPSFYAVLYQYPKDQVFLKVNHYARSIDRGQVVRNINKLSAWVRHRANKYVLLLTRKVRGLLKHHGTELTRSSNYLMDHSYASVPLL